jgi:hypothetical protein
MLVIDQLGGPVPLGGGEVAGGELAGAGPADEPAGFFAVAGVLIGEPAVQVGLAAAAQGEVVGVEPVQERDGAAGQPADHAGLLPGDRPAVAAAS